MRFALISNIIHARPREEADANHQATCISTKDKSATICVCVHFKWYPKSQSTIKQLLQQSKPFRQGYIQQSVEQRRQRATDRSAREKKEEKRKT
jgi:hypothetical protein